MRHHLHSPAKIVSAAFALNHVLVNLAGRDVVFTGQGNAEIALVIAKVKVHFSAIVQHKDLAMSAGRLVLSVLHRPT